MTKGKTIKNAETSKHAGMEKIKTEIQEGLNIKYRKTLIRAFNIITLNKSSLKMKSQML